MVRIIVHLLLFALICHEGFGQVWDEEKERQLNSFIESLIECRDNVGMFISLVKDGEVAFTGGYGYRNLGQQLPVTSSTRFNIGSLTKAFTTTLAADVISRTSGFSWDTPIRSILGEEFHLQDNFRTNETTLKDLFSHKMGMPSYWGVSTAGMGIDRETLAMERFQHIPVRFPFRSQYLYSNYLYQLGAYVTETVGGESWEEHIYRALLDPLGMDQTRVSVDMASSEWQNSAYSYTFIDDELTQNPEEDQRPFLDEIGPAGGLFSSADDMAKWMLFHLDGGRAQDGSVVVPESALRATYTAESATGRESPRVQRPRFPVDDMSLTYAIGWRNGMYRGREKVFHTGSYSSYNCYLSLLPDAHSGACACVNSPGDGRGSRAVHLATMFAHDLLLDEEPWLNDTTACTYPDPWSTSLPLDDEDLPTDPHYDITPQTGPTKKRPLTEYVGVYSHPAFGDFHVILDEDDDILTYEFGMLLSGVFNPSENPDDFYMTLNHPLSYRAAFFPQYPNGFPVYFSASDGDNIDTIQVPYLEFGLPPIFVKSQ